MIDLNCRRVWFAGLFALGLVLGGCGDDGGGANVDQASANFNEALSSTWSQTCGCSYQKGSANYNSCMDQRGTVSLSACEEQAAKCHAQNFVKYMNCGVTALHNFKKCMSGCIDPSSTAAQNCTDQYNRAAHGCEQIVSFGLSQDLNTCEQVGSLDQCTK